MDIGLALGAPNSFSGGLKNVADLAQFDEAMRSLKARRLQEGALGDYLQSLGGASPAPATPAPGQPSVKMVPPGPGGAGAAMAGAAQPTVVPDTSAAGAPPQQMSLDGLMSFLKGRGITGEDAYETAMQFQPWLKAEDARKLGQMKFEVDLKKLLIANGFDEAKAKNEAARVAAFRERTKAMYGKGGQRDQVRALDKTVQQLTVGRQKLAQQRDNIVNAAKNAGRMLTDKEQATITQINHRIQTVDNGMTAAREQQALMLGGQNYGQQQDDLLAPDTSESSAAGVDTSDLDGGGGG